MSRQRKLPVPGISDLSLIAIAEVSGARYAFFLEDAINARTYGEVADAMVTINRNQYEETKALARFARQSPYLKLLAIHVKSLSICRLVESLASLKELVTLNICCFPVPSSPPEKVPIDQLPVLSSVKLLEMHFLANSHHDYEQLHLEALLPNLTTVLWNHMDVSCRDCRYLIPPEEIALCQRDPKYLHRNARQFKAKYGHQMQKCLRLARLAAFSRLPQRCWLPLSPTTFANVEPPRRRHQR
ncbi:hypothetical protein TYRP_023775 [Tyrophagus putrescentiae]|nr:hypothetical protein TYRP_023152 [Tyrophagus putrescentiae]KAH9390329.1 hypothetical protein TYRP_023156 [Tyrophagus putrescentiae]KAH9390331.1 hypothetical protein TYRP_023158 [Tyrophagus putrescentiae]KAH9390342.1 hypothetical protein TYRP_023169 [Tyrophagus putrescentiae]KAH9407393.1 hypothetical protein TYRP_023775 [Tyrophagus putrescentiae]